MGDVVRRMHRLADRTGICMQAATRQALDVASLAARIDAGEDTGRLAYELAQALDMASTCIAMAASLYTEAARELDPDGWIDA